MSTKVSSWVWHEIPEPLVGNELILMLALADVSDDRGRCIYVASETGLTYDALAAKVRVDRRTIERLIPKLRDRGLIEVSKGVKGRPNEFRLLVPWALGSSDNLSGNGSEVAADSPTAVQDSPTADALFPDNGDSHSSYRRERKNNVGAPQKRGTRIPDPFIVNAEMKAWAADRAPLVNYAISTERFVNYWRAKTRDATKLDWLGTWRNWLLKDQEDAERRRPAKLSPSERAMQTLALAGDPQRGISA